MILAGMYDGYAWNEKHGEVGRPRDVKLSSHCVTQVYIFWMRAHVKILALSSVVFETNIKETRVPCKNPLTCV